MLTKRQLELLKFIERYIAENSRSPTRREMGAALGVSHVAAHALVGRLADRGIIREARGGRERQVIILERPPTPRRATLYAVRKRDRALRPIYDGADIFTVGP